MKKKVFFTVLCCVLGALTLAQPLYKAPAAAAAEAGYELYPVPQSVVYTGGTLDVPDQAALFVGADVDAATVDALYDALSILDLLAYRDNAPAGAVEVYVGIYGSGDAADVKAAACPGFDAQLFSGTDAYFLSIGDEIVLVGRDTDAAFYGVTTLKMILGQVSGRKLRRLTIADWSDSAYRGFIEGYYGIPWTTEERIELMEFGSRFKSNIYIYAPKDDAYHSANWRGLYTPADLAELKEQIEAGRRTKTRFAWSVHPFLHDPITAANYADGLAAIETKFEQLYAAGVRQFVVSADDVEVPEGTTVDGGLHGRLLSDLAAWCRAKGDCYDMIFVPSAYCYRSAERLKVELEPYFTSLQSTIDPSVMIMWTGNDVCSKISTGKFDEFAALTGAKPFFWLNWPVNDYSTKHLLCGKAEVLDVLPADGVEPDFVGVVTNPMQQAEPSKMSIFAVADYCWNLSSFDADVSYAASLKYVEPTETEAFAELTRHLTNANEYEGAYFEESADFVPLIETFVADYEAGRSVADSAAALDARFGILEEASRRFLTNASNKALVASMRPWAEALGILARSMRAYLDVLVNVGTRPTAETAAAFEAAGALYATLADCKAPVLNKINYNYDLETVGFGVAVLAPFAQELIGMTRDDVLIARGENTGVTYRGFESVYRGEPSLAADGRDDTFVWFGSKPKANGFIRLDLGEETLIRDIRILNGNNDGGDRIDAFVEVSSDAKSYTTVGTIGAKTENRIDLRAAPVSARFVRLRNRDTATWVAVREIAVNVMTGIDGLITYQGIELESSVETDLYGMTDSALATYTWFGVNDTAGAWIQLDLLEKRAVSYVQLLMAKPDSMADYLSDVTLSWSADGTTFAPIGTFTGTRSVMVRLETPVEARYIRATSNTATGCGVVVRDFSVNKTPAVSYGDGFKQYDDVRAGCALSHPSFASDGDEHSFLDLEALAEGERTITLDLRSIGDVSRVEIVSGGETWGDVIERLTLSYSADGVTFTDIGTYEAADGAYALALDAAVSARYIRVTVLNAGWITLREFSAG